jgi:hypothetical protein
MLMRGAMSRALMPAVIKGGLRVGRNVDIVGYGELVRPRLDALGNALLDKF